jgi:hypothetical protein
VSGGKRLVENMAGWAYKGLTCLILRIAGLLADQHDLSASRSFTENSLGRVLPQRTGPA